MQKMNLVTNIFKKDYCFIQDGGIKQTFEQGEIFMKSLIDGFDVYNINPNREKLEIEKERYLKDVYGVNTVNIDEEQKMSVYYNKILTCKWADKNLGGYSIYSDYDVIQKRSIVGLEMKRLVLDCEHGKHYIPQKILKRYGIGREIKKYY